MRYLASEDGFELIIDVKDDSTNVGIYSDRAWMDSLASVSRSTRYDRESDSIVWEPARVSMSSINTFDSWSLTQHNLALEYAINLKIIFDYDKENSQFFGWLQRLEKEEG